MSSRYEPQINYLANLRIVFKWAMENNDLNRADIELLIYLNSIGIFTVQDFKDGTLTYVWDNDRFYRLQREDWLKKIHDGISRIGEHNKYCLTTKAKHLLARMDKYLQGIEPIPESTKRNKIMRGASYSDRAYRDAIKMLNKKKR